MAISNLTGVGKIDKHLYYYTVRFYAASQSGVFSFVSDRIISDKNDLRQFILDKGEGSSIYTLRVSGSFIDAYNNGEKISLIRAVEAKTNNNELTIRYDHYNSTNIVSGLYYFHDDNIYIFGYSII